MKAESRKQKAEIGRASDTYFMPYQAEWIRDQGHLKICEKGRQIGLSYADS